MAFTPIESGIGGILIGLSAAGAYVIDGKITGISGLLGPFLRGVIQLNKLEGGHLWKMLFLLGLLIGGMVNFGLNKSFAFPDAMTFSPVRYSLGGLAIGIGTRCGRGCTSGHGICGLPRFSLRSWIAVPLFMLIAGATVALTRHALNVYERKEWAVAELQWPPRWEFPLGALGTSLLLLFIVALVPKSVKTFLSPLLLGLMFGLGLGVSGMTNQSKVLDFLDLGGTWDPSLAFVMGCGLCCSFPAFFWSERRAKEPLIGGSFEKPAKFGDYKLLIVGNIFFGLGWGIVGICPGPAVAGVIPYLAQGWGAGLSFGLCFVMLCVAWLLTDRLLRHPFNQIETNNTVEAFSTATQEDSKVDSEHQSPDQAEASVDSA
eukprot:TRINITY_DN4210_c0_g1_i1.p1 TRINITY_DN4210_c0_g1~~TRINITY_DN4210_c0_g1_i1.p1  ORF type:complete len:374 (+),score=59.12 TRINITY_DN4210_c0_g1_i1:84-1205(+)